MDWFAKVFLKCSLVWLSLGVTLGVSMAAQPAWAVYRPAHLHMLLLGFVSMMICGVAYHVIPRFVGAPLFSTRLPVVHLIAANSGLACMATGFVLRASGVHAGGALLASGGVLSAAGAYLFAYVLWRTMSAKTGPSLVLPVSAPRADTRSALAPR
jgi:NAD/NADP transhydrogenase beta subunit